MNVKQLRGWAGLIVTMAIVVVMLNQVVNPSEQAAPIQAEAFAIDGSITLPELPTTVQCGDREDLARSLEDFVNAARNENYPLWGTTNELRLWSDWYWRMCFPQPTLSPAYASPTP